MKGLGAQIPGSTWLRHGTFDSRESHPQLISRMFSGRGDLASRSCGLSGEPLRRRPNAKRGARQVCLTRTNPAGPVHSSPVHSRGMSSCLGNRLATLGVRRRKIVTSDVDLARERPLRWRRWRGGFSPGLPTWLQVIAVRARVLPPRSTAGQLTLDQHIGVRIPGGQPNRISNLSFIILPKKPLSQLFVEEFGGFRSLSENLQEKSDAVTPRFAPRTVEDELRLRNFLHIRAESAATTVRRDRGWACDRRGTGQLSALWPATALAAFAGQVPARWRPLSVRKNPLRSRRWPADRRYPRKS